MDEYFKYLQEKNSALKKQAEEYKETDRLDEANLLKVRANIYEVCGTVCKVHLSRPGNGAEACRAQLAKFRSIWGAERDRAAAHGDTVKTVIEDIKLEALKDITEKFEEVFK